MKVEAEVFEEYVLTLKNKDTCMGQYYAEDDWDIIIRGKNLYEIIETGVKRIVDSGINVEYCYLDKRQVIKYNDIVVDLKTLEELPNNEAEVVYNKLINTTEYAKLKEERRHQKELEEQKEIEAHKKKLEEEERKQYEKLKVKFDKKES